MSKKRALLDLVVSTLTRELESIAQSAKAAHEAATHEESKAEDAHDTRGLEASYLAAGQMARIDSLKKVIASYQFMKLPDFKPSDPIGVGALVELTSAGKTLHCFLVN